MIDILRPFLSRVIGALVAAFAAWLAAKGFDFDKDTQQQMVENLVGIILPLFGVIWAVVHKLIDKKVNPGDAASSQLIEEHHIENAQLKAADSNNPSVIH